MQATSADPDHYEGTKPPEVSEAKWRRPLITCSRKKARAQPRWLLFVALCCGLLRSFLYGLVLIHLMPSFSKDCVFGAERIGASLGLGLLVEISLFMRQ